MPGEEGELDAFDFPEGAATEVFIDPFACYTVNPAQWAELQEVVTGEEDPEEALRRAGAGPGAGAVVFLTPAQLAACRRELESMGPAPDTVTAQACAFYLRDCLYRARIANGRSIR